MKRKSVLLLLYFLCGSFLEVYSTVKPDSIPVSSNDTIMYSILDEIVIAARPSGITLKADKVSFNPESMISGGQGNIFDALISLPGINVSSNGQITQYGVESLTVYIDGRKNILTGDNLVSYLKSLSVEDIAKIEIMETIGAKGEGGDSVRVLNIVRKRRKTDSYSLDVNLDGQYGKARQLFGALFANYNRHNHNIGINCSRYLAGNPSELLTDRPYANGNERLTQAYDRHRNDGSFFLGCDYEFACNANLVIGSRLNFNHWKRDEMAKMDTDIPTERESLSTNNHAEFRMDNLFGDVYVSHQSSDSNNHWIAASDFFNNSSTENQLMSDNTGKMIEGIMNGNTKGLISSFDYAGQMTEKLQLVFGGRVSLVKMKSHGFYEESSIKSSKYKSKELGSDNRDVYGSDFGYRENVNAFYAETKLTPGKTVISLGLRVEQSNLKSFFSGNESFDARNLSRDAFHLYPSLSLMLFPSERSSWILAYTTKTVRPRFSDLDPFIHIFDDITHVGGNINLKESDSQSVTLAWSDNRQLRVSLRGEYERNSIVKYYRKLSQRIVYVTPENIPTHIQFMTGITYGNLKLKSWSEISLSANLLYSKYRFHKDIDLEENFLFTPMVDINCRIQLPWNISLDVNGSFRGKLAYGQARISSVWKTYMGLRRIFYNGRLSLSLYMKDIFNSNHISSSILLSGQSAILIEKEYEDMRKIGLSVSWNMNGGSGKANRREKKPLIEEMNRINM